MFYSFECFDRLRGSNKLVIIINLFFTLNNYRSIMMSHLVLAIRQVVAGHLTSAVILPQVVSHHSTSVIIIPSCHNLCNRQIIQTCDIIFRLIQRYLHHYLTLFRHLAQFLLPSVLKLLLVHSLTNFLVQLSQLLQLFRLALID